MCRPELDRTQLYFTAFQPPTVHWSNISAFTLSLPGQKTRSPPAARARILHTQANTHCPAMQAFLVIAGTCWQMSQLRFKTYLTLAEDSELRPTLVHSALLIKLPLL